MKLWILTLILVTFALGVSLDYLNFFDQEIGEPLYRFSLFAALPFSLILILRSPAKLHSWVRFSAWSIPLAFFLIAISPSTNGTWLPLLSVTKESMTLITGGLFTVTSILIIVRSNRT